MTLRARVAVSVAQAPILVYATSHPFHALGMAGHDDESAFCSGADDADGNTCCMRVYSQCSATALAVPEHVAYLLQTTPAATVLVVSEDGSQESTLRA